MTNFTVFLHDHFNAGFLPDLTWPLYNTIITFSAILPCLAAVFVLAVVLKNRPLLVIAFCLQVLGLA